MLEGLSLAELILTKPFLHFYRYVEPDLALWRIE